MIKKKNIINFELCYSTIQDYAIYKATKRRQVCYIKQLWDLQNPILEFSVKPRDIILYLHWENCRDLLGVHKSKRWGHLSINTLSLTQNAFSWTKCILFWLKFLNEFIPTNSMLIVSVSKPFPETIMIIYATSSVYFVERSIPSNDILTYWNDV